MVYSIENEELVCRVDLHGAELISVKDKAEKKEHMWNGDARYWNRISPVLFPFVGAPKDKKYIYQGKSYPMSQHGFARDMEFSFKSSTENEIWMQLRENNSTLEVYPFSFCLEIGYRLYKRSITVMWHVINKDDKEMYFSIGAHPGFMIDRDKNTYFELYDPEGKPVSEFENRIFGEGGCVTDRTEVISTPGGKLPITRSLFDGDALVVENGQIGCVKIKDERINDPIVTVEFTSPLLGLWSPPHKNAPFVCIEPWYGRCDAESFEKELQDREYEQRLKAGGDFRAEYIISV
ncbi:MAG: aldose 1-epimerase family protein [Lachnospiraceae bacterium]|nr:aldose 1-epimerase family protein [Lachnospiraceae bacterium]